jgi:tetratricopeptide (TPR) repeat protein
MFRLKKFTFVAVSLLLLITNARATQTLNEAAELNDEAVACVKDHQYQRAVDLLKRAIALQPNLSMAHYNLGRTYQMTDEVDLAIEAFKHAVDLNPEFVAALH